MNIYALYEKKTQQPVLSYELEGYHFIIYKDLYFFMSGKDKIKSKLYFPTHEAGYDPEKKMYFVQEDDVFKVGFE